LSRIYLFVDESGNLDFSPKGSRYFILTSVAIEDCSIESEMLNLRRDLVWEGQEIQDAFHATEELQAIRSEVFKLICRHNLRVDATIFEKARARKNFPRNEEFYEIAWYLHMQHVASRAAEAHDELHIIGASFATKAKQSLLVRAVNGLVSSTLQQANIRTCCWPASTEPCLQVADYCCWAIQRKWERGDERSHGLIKHMIKTEFNIFNGR
jgi:hypothetical protein